MASEAEQIARRVKAYGDQIGRPVNVGLQGTKHKRYVITAQGAAKVPLATFSAHSASPTWKANVTAELSAKGLLPPKTTKKKEEAVPRLTSEEIVTSDAMRDRIRDLIRRYPNEEEARLAIVEKALVLAGAGKIEEFSGQDEAGVRSVVATHLKRLLDEGGGWKRKNQDRFGPVLDYLEASLNGNGNGNGHQPTAETPDEGELEEIDLGQAEADEEAEPEVEGDARTVIEVDLDTEAETLVKVAEEAMQDAERQCDEALATVAELRANLEEANARLNDSELSRQAQAERIAELSERAEGTLLDMKGVDPRLVAEEDPRFRLVEMLGKLREAQSPEQRAAEAELALAIRRLYAESLIRFVERTDALSDVPDSVFETLDRLSGVE